MLVLGEKNKPQRNKGLFCVTENLASIKTNNNITCTWHFAIILRSNIIILQIPKKALAVLLSNTTAVMILDPSHKCA